MGLKLNGAHQLEVYADDVNLLGDNIDTINKNRETLIDASKENGLEVNTEKFKYTCCCFVTRMQGEIANRCFGNVSPFRYLGMIITYQTLNQEEIKRKLNLGKLPSIETRTFCLFVCCLKT
jgi:hypothetical protein